MIKLSYCTKQITRQHPNLSVSAFYNTNCQPTRSVEHLLAIEKMCKIRNHLKKTDIDCEADYTLRLLAQQR